MSAYIIVAIVGVSSILGMGVLGIVAAWLYCPWPLASFATLGAIFLVCWLLTASGGVVKP